MHLPRSQLLMANIAAILHITQAESPTSGNYRMLSATINQYPPEKGNTTINEGFSVVVQGTNEGSLPVECGLLWNVTAPRQQQLRCTDHGFDAFVHQTHTSPEYGFQLFFMLK